MSVDFKVYNFNTQQYTTNENLLSYTDVEEDNEGRYYLDINFSDLLTYMYGTSTDGDYLLAFHSTLQSYLHPSVFGNSTTFDFITKYETLDYFRFHYYSELGVGLLVATDENGTTLDNQSSVVNGDEPSEEPDDPNVIAINNQTNVISEQTNIIAESVEVQKNIFQQLLDLPGLIIDGLLNMLKSIFIPSEDFFTDWIDDLNEYFGDAFGILYYPLEVIIDFLNRIGQISETNTAIISIPEFNLSFMGYEATFFSGFSYDLNDILENETFETIHNIYLVITDIILWLGVVYLAANCIRNVIGGMSNEVVDEATAEESSYQKYSQYRKNKSRYNKEHKTGGK